ncbi:MAG: SRPBCC domain-containing protein [Candidatus Thermoplasmatota archaeon]|nr:SRPBCC domain-containing protein [Candidatus Thermoplasmatota archaeon]
MEFSGSVIVSASASSVVGLLSDTKSVLEALPGIQSSEIKDDSHLSVQVKMGTAFIKGRFNMDIEINRRSPTNVEVNGKGHGAGSSLEMHIDANVVDQGSDRCEVRWAVNAKIGGAIASLGARFVEPTAKSYIEEFISNVREKLEQH